MPFGYIEYYKEDHRKQSNQDGEQPSSSDEKLDDELFETVRGSFRERLKNVLNMSDEDLTVFLKGTVYEIKNDKLVIEPPL